MGNDYLISKEKFVETMEKIIELNNVTEKFNEAIEMLCGDGWIAFTKHETIIVDLLKICVGDTEDWLDWWLWENYYGERISDTSLAEVDGTPIDVKTPEKLYDFLVSRKEKTN